MRHLVSIRELELPLGGELPCQIRVLAEHQRSATWLGHIELLPHRGRKWLRAARETSQPNMKCLQYWATGLEPLYFEGALDRARRQRRRRHRSRPHR